MAILGANGAGKTTLLRILATLLLPTRGTARLAGHDTARESACSTQTNWGITLVAIWVFYPRLTGRENLRFFGQLNHLPAAVLNERITTLGDRFNVMESLDRQVRTLSTGTIQRLSLLRALLHEPKVLLLDEPTRSMDAIAAEISAAFSKPK